MAHVGSCLKNLYPEGGDDIEEFFSDENRTKLQVTGEIYAGEYLNKSEIKFDRTSPEKGFTTEALKNIK